MFNPFFEPSTLTVQELYDKIDEINNRISVARTAGMSYEMIQGMYSIINACNEELLTRMSKAEMEENTDTCIFDLESYLNPSKEDDEQAKHKRKQNYKPGEW